MNKPMYELINVNQRDDGLFVVQWVERDGRKNKDLCNYENVKDYIRICGDTGDPTELMEFKKKAIEDFLNVKPKKSRKKKEGKKHGTEDNQKGTIRS